MSLDKNIKENTMTFFDYTSLTDEVQHGLTLLERLLPVIVLFIFIFLIYKYKDTLRNYKNEHKIRYVFGSLMLIGELSFIIWNFTHSLNGEVRFINTLPLQLCSYAIWGLAFVMFTKSKRVYTTVFIFSIVSVLALIFPNLNHGFNSFRYYQLYFSHSLLILALIYLYKVHGLYPNKKDFINSFIVLQVIIVYSLILNAILDTDFLFIGEGNKPIDFAWDWPLHMIQYELFMIFIYYLFYRILKKVKN